ncbi:MAG: relaxase/mobilization nuclease domain-containing protein [Oscillospiraceae bacterium]|nr:relaxase/mobilization nuclease domain-containing protein [Oscillospiraceae bacterium]
MAVTSIWPIKGRIDGVINYARNPEKTTEKAMAEVMAMHAVKNVMEYTANDIKTEQRKYVTGINCSEETAASEFMNTKILWNKTSGRQCYHGYQSFAQDEVTAEIAHEIGVKLAERLWGDRFEVLVATHLNTGHYHSHFVINSVSFADGYKFYNSPEDYKKMKQISDELCREYGLSVITDPSGKSKSYAERKAEKAGQPTIRDTVRRDIDAAIKASVTQQQFIRAMEMMGYQFKLYDTNGERLKYPAIKPPGAKGYFRFHKLGADYELPMIVQRIKRNWTREEPFPDMYVQKKYSKGKLNGSFEAVLKKNSLYGLYMRYKYELIKIKKHPTSVRSIPMSMREDIVKMDSFMKQSETLGKYRIKTIGQLTDTKALLTEKISQLTADRNDLRNALRRTQRAGNEPETAKLKEQITDISNQIKALRKEIDCLEKVEQRSAQVAENIKVITADRAEFNGRNAKTRDERRYR